MYAVGLTTSRPAIDLLEAGADRVVTNLVGFDVDWLMGELEARAKARA